MYSKTLEIKLTNAHFEEIIKKGYSLDMIFMLKLFEETDEAYSSSPKIINILQALTRKGLLTEGEEVTDEGRELLKFLSSKEDKPKIPRKKKEITDDDFTKWWKAFPATDTFIFKGRQFKGSRALKTKKDECRTKIEKILKEGEYSIDLLIEALQLEVNQKMENSYKTGTNKMSYMQNSLTYLNQRTFEAFIELIKAGHKVKEVQQTSIMGGIDI